MLLKLDGYGRFLGETDPEGVIQRDLARINADESRSETATPTLTLNMQQVSLVRAMIRGDVVDWRESDALVRILDDVLRLVGLTGVSSQTGSDGHG